MSIQAVEQSLNKYLLYREDTFDPIDEEVIDLIEAIAYYIIKKENHSPKTPLGCRAGYFPAKDFVKKYSWISTTTLLMLTKIYPTSDFYYTYKNRIFYHPQKAAEVARGYSSHFKKKIDQLEAKGLLGF